MPNRLPVTLVAWRADNAESIPYEMGRKMDLDSTEDLQAQLSHHFTLFLGEEVKVSKQEALFIATVIWTGAARPPRELLQVRP